MKKFFKYLFGIVFLLILLLVIVVRVLLHEPRPEILANENADIMATNMLKAVDKEAWDSLKYISWSFRGAHHYTWDRTSNQALIEWEDYAVHFDPDKVDGIVFENGQKIASDQDDKIIQKAWSYWCNDMFWLSAPFKIRDKGVALDVAMDKDGQKGLLVSYESGGVTPGDSYLWLLDEDHLPTGYKMWVKIIPIGGVYTSWEKWTTLEGGAKVSSFHQGNIDALKIDVGNIKAGDSWEDLGHSESPIQL